MVMAVPENCIQNAVFRADRGEDVIFWHKLFLFFRLQLEQSSWLAPSSVKVCTSRPKMLYYII